MLGRTASSLFWMSRYQERTLNLSKLLEAVYRTGMTSHAGPTEEDNWRFALSSSGCDAGYREKFDEISARHVASYMIFDKTNPSSVRVCMETARNNARSVRTGITAELWEAINTTWLEFADVNPQSITQDRLPEFLAWISQRSHLFRGALLNTILRDDGYYFSQFGNFIERADNTARILNTQYWALLPDNDIIGDAPTERTQWLIILRALSGRRSYRFAYKDAKLKAYNIAEFLILREAMPRSLAHCYAWISETADDLERFYGASEESLEMAREISRELSSDTMSAIYQDGLGDFLTEFIGRNNALSHQLCLDYNFA